MARDKQLVPVFIPPLATLLARAEQVKGTALTETEIARIRDKASCIMMAVNDAKKMEERRGYRDVDPENCWADWHRLRIQLTGKGYLPKIVLCLPGGKNYPKECQSILAQEGVEHEIHKRDKRMVEAFEIGRAHV